MSVQDAFLGSIAMFGSITAVLVSKQLIISANSLNSLIFFSSLDPFFAYSDLQTISFSQSSPISVLVLCLSRHWSCSVSVSFFLVPHFFLSYDSVLSIEQYNQIRAAYLDQVDFTSMIFDEALRYVCIIIDLPCVQLSAFLFCQCDGCLSFSFSFHKLC